MKKRILSVLGSLAILVGVFSISATNADAADTELKKVDGSYLTTDDFSEGISSDRTRGQHMMDGECSISKAGTKRVYCYGATTANHDVDYLAVIVYVDQYDEEEEMWGQIDWWMVEKENDFFVNTGKTITVDRGYYYRVHADHFVREGDDPIEETFSATNGILVPKSN